MARVLLAWELGEGISYTRTLAKIAQALVARGHQPIFAVKDLARANAVITGDFPILQAPFCHPRAWFADTPFVASTFADVLALKGYASVETLLPLIEAWQGLLDLIQPQLLIVSYAPSLCLAAYRTLPVIDVSSAWFNMPPLMGDKFPDLVAGRTPLVSQHDMLATVQEVQQRRGRSFPATLPGMLSVDHRFLMMLPDLDPYRRLREESHWDPLESLPTPQPSMAGRSFFAYLNADYPRAEDVLQTVMAAGWPGAAYLGGSSAEQRFRLRQHGVDILEKPATEEQMLNYAVLLHHGGIGTSQVALAAGRPQLRMARLSASCISEAP